MVKRKIDLMDDCLSDISPSSHLLSSPLVSPSCHSSSSSLCKSHSHSSSSSHSHQIPSHSTHHHYDHQDKYTSFINTRLLFTAILVVVVVILIHSPVHAAESDGNKSSNNNGPRGLFNQVNNWFSRLRGNRDHSSGGSHDDKKNDDKKEDASKSAAASPAGMSMNPMMAGYPPGYPMMAAPPGYSPFGPMGPMMGGMPVAFGPPIGMATQQFAQHVPAAAQAATANPAAAGARPPGMMPPGMMAPYGSMVPFGFGASPLMPVSDFSDPLRAPPHHHHHHHHPDSFASPYGSSPYGGYSGPGDGMDDPYASSSSPGDSMDSSSGPGGSGSTGNDYDAYQKKK